MTGPRIFIKKNATMVFYNEKEQLYPETDVLGIDLGESLSKCGRDIFPKE